MITTDQIDDWLREIGARPASAQAILRSIAARLVELDKWNEELLADNIELRSGQRVSEYEQRIAALESQLELLKRQVINTPSPTPLSSSGAKESLLFFHPKGWLLRMDLADERISGTEIARFSQPFEMPDAIPGMLSAGSQEELMLVFDSGRIVLQSLSKLPTASNNLEWNQAYRVQPRPGEELVTIFPIGNLALFDFCVQVSRRACAKLMPKSSFQGMMAKGSIGAGIKRKPDKTAGLVLANRDDQVVLATYEGNLLSLPVPLLPYTVDEVLQLSPTDHLISSFNPRRKETLLAFTNIGKVIYRETGWLEPAASFKSRGQSLFSSSRRDAGVRQVGAICVNEADWCVILNASGKVIMYQASRLMSGVAISDGEAPNHLVAVSACTA